MNVISNFIGRILFFFRSLGSNLTSPFRSFAYSIRSLRVSNPFTQIGQFFRGIESQIRYYLKLPDRALPAQKGGSSAGGVSQRETRADRQRFRQRAKVSQRAQYSQIHLIQEATQERTVVHIGTIIGRSASEVMIESPNHRPAHMRFSQVDPLEHKAPMLLTYVAGEATVEVNSVEVNSEAPLPNNAALKIDDQDYTCQLFAWDKEPVVTRVEAGWSTDVGPTREENQDAIGIYQHPDAYLFAIADGVGTGQYGNVVSEFTIRYLLAVFHKNAPYHLRWHDVLKKGFQSINAEVRHFARYSPSAEGTTLTAIVIKGMEAHVAHVGDSRLYHWHEGFLKQVTRDHTGEEVIEQDTRAANETVEPTRKRDVLAKAIGKSDTIAPDIFTIALQPDDRLFLCTDGLSHVIPDDELAFIFPTMRAERLAAHLVGLANERQAQDNISAITIEILKEGFVEDLWLAENGERVYAGYSRSWPMRLNRPRDIYTAMPVTSRSGFWAIVGLILVIIVVALVVRSGGINGSVAAQNDAPTPPPLLISKTAVPTKKTPEVSPSATFTPSKTPAPTLPPTATDIRPSSTPAVAPTLIPPTSTLRPSSAGVPLLTGRI